MKPFLFIFYANEKKREEQRMSEKTKRYRKLDELRGLILISMIGYHLMWDLVYLFRMDCDWYQGTVGYIWQQSICWSFILLSGFCWRFARKKWKRGLEVFVAGVVITIVTSIAMPEQRVMFGVLTCLGSCMLIMIPVEKILTCVLPKIGVVASGILFFLTRNINEGYLGFEKVRLYKIPKLLYENEITTYFGFPEKDFFSGDYFSLFPWFFLFLIGYFMNKLIPVGVMELMRQGECKVLEALGKNSLWIYMIHQPLIYGILLVASEFAI